MIDLYLKKYNRKTLKAHIYEVKLIDILKTQKIDATFAARYILNEKYQFDKEDKKITFDLVLKYQPHIIKDILYNEIINYESADDSIENFEIIATRKL
jgi:hypothetical protein